MPRSRSAKPTWPGGAEELNLRMSQIKLKAEEAEHAGENRDQLSQGPRQLDEPPEDALIDFGNYYALIIGNSSYRAATSLQALKSPEIDAEAIAALLERKYGYIVMLLVDASRDQILGAMNTQGNPERTRQPVDLLCRAWLP